MIGGGLVDALRLRGLAGDGSGTGRATSCILIWMDGGPSHYETFDPKPGLARVDGQPMPESFTRGQQLAQLQGQKLVCLAPMFRFRTYGANGTEISELRCGPFGSGASGVSPRRKNERAAPQPAAMMLELTPRWVPSAPFGFPVVPEV